jgi:integration host factor subunit beta
MLELVGKRDQERLREDRARYPMTKKDLARVIAEEMDLPQLQVQEIVQRVFDGITETLVREGRIELRNFGVFQVKQRKSRKAHNPRTREKLKIPARMVVTFKPGREMEERVGRLKKVPGGAAVAATPSEAAK